jgi:uncharacterized protein YPO0396
MTYECPHGNEVNERCAQCVASGGQPGDEYARRHRMNAHEQYAADNELRRRSGEQLRRRIDAENARQRAIEERIEYNEGGGS